MQQKVGKPYTTIKFTAGGTNFIVATGGTETTLVIVKFIHLQVQELLQFLELQLLCAPVNNVVSYMVVAGGGGGGKRL